MGWSEQGQRRDAHRDDCICIGVNRRNTCVTARAAQVAARQRPHRVGRQRVSHLTSMKDWSAPMAEPSSSDAAASTLDCTSACLSASAAHRARLTGRDSPDGGGPTCAAGAAGVCATGGPAKPAKAALLRSRRRAAQRSGLASSIVGAAARWRSELSAACITASPWVGLMAPSPAGTGHKGRGEVALACPGISC